MFPPSLVLLVSLGWSYFVGTRSAIGSCNLHWKSRIGGAHRQRGSTYAGVPVADGVPLSSARCTRYLSTCFWFSRVLRRRRFRVCSIFFQAEELGVSCILLTDE